MTKLILLFIYMGQSQSNQTLYNGIISEINKIITDYSLWTKDDICEKLSIIYYDKLIKFPKDQLKDAGTLIGIKYNSDIDKNDLCIKIINHYRARIELMTDIRDNLIKNYNKISKLSKGDICTNVNEYVDDFFKCDKMNGIWLNDEQYKYHLMKLKNNGKSKERLKYMSELNKEWKTNLESIKNIIKIIKNDKNNDMTDFTFNNLKTESQYILDKLDKIINTYYTFIINLI